MQFHLRRLTRHAPPFAIAIVAATLLLGCSADDSASAPPVEPASPETSTRESADASAISYTAESADDGIEDGFPVTVRNVEIAARPERIVSLSPTVTEMLFAIGSGDAVVAADEYSNHPEDAPTTDLSGFQPNVEAIAAFEPDLVVASDNRENLGESLEAIGIPLLLVSSATDIDDAYRQIEQLGVATGNIAGAAAVVAEMQSQIDAIIANIDLPDEPLTYYHELTPDYYTVSSDTFIGAVYEMVGLTSIADAVGESGGEYPQLSPEHIIESDPDIILLADTQCCGVTVEAVGQRPGWDTITAVQNGAIVELDEDIASRWGPRIVELLRDVADVIRQLEPVA
ncbi:MAG: ABC transporter substrate-binding protein [Nitriliruptoraceae bacterium]